MFIEQTEERLRSSSTQNNQMQQMIPPRINNSNDVEVLSFDKYQIVLPKGDLKKEWEKLKKYMDIKLEDYKYEKPEIKLEDLSEEDQELVRNMQIEGSGD